MLYSHNRPRFQLVPDTDSEDDPDFFPFPHASVKREVSPSLIAENLAAIALSKTEKKQKLASLCFIANILVSATAIASAEYLLSLFIHQYKDGMLSTLAIFLASLPVFLGVVSFMASVFSLVPPPSQGTSRSSRLIKCFLIFYLPPLFAAIPAFLLHIPSSFLFLEVTILKEIIESSSAHKINSLPPDMALVVHLVSSSLGRMDLPSLFFTALLIFFSVSIQSLVSNTFTHPSFSLEALVAFAALCFNSVVVLAIIYLLSHFLAGMRFGPLYQSSRGLLKRLLTDICRKTHHRIFFFFLLTFFLNVLLSAHLCYGPISIHTDGTAMSKRQCKRYLRLSIASIALMAALVAGTKAYLSRKNHPFPP